MNSITQSKKKSRKAANGAGTIYKRQKRYKRKDGSIGVCNIWEGQATIKEVDPKTGNTIRKTVTGKSQEEVRLKLAEITAKVDKGTYKHSSKLKVAEWLDMWLKDYTDDIKDTTITVYKSVIDNHLRNAFNGVYLCKLEPHHVQHYFKALNDAGDLSRKTIKNIHGVLHKALEQACQNKIIETNPASHCKLKSVAKTEINTLDRYEIQPFLKALEDDEYRSIITVDLFTGLRISEIVGLTWDCVDFNNGILIIDKQLSRINGELDFQTTKNGKMRVITPAPFIMDMLQSVRREQLEKRFAAGDLWSNPDNLVFTKADGSPLAQNTIRKHMKKAAAAIGRPELRFHDLRHSFATISIQAGDDFKTISDNMGHYSVAFTMDRYAKATDSMKKESADRMQAYFNQLG